MLPFSDSPSELDDVSAAAAFATAIAIIAAEGLLFHDAQVPLICAAEKAKRRGRPRSPAAARRSPA